ncbi:hypothetical protein TIFTF001_034463 [Ficus carica]|uniref:Uncharacterized protein n=1 Tax=Ficus carica TaxID=3494 RepID=A0AA88E0H4_FICCA|nr:hypothetical protein TIFTF001_034463 [Ficus carica]
MFKNKLRKSFQVRRQASCLVSYRPATRAGLVHDFSWIGLAAPTTPWLRVTVSNLSAILDTRRSLQSWYQSGFPAIHFHGLPASATVIVVLASRCLAENARLWWLTLGLPDVQGLAWADFRAFILAHFGPLPDKEANMPYRDPRIYNDIYMRQYLNYVAEWQAYPNESMGYYCQRFREAMLPYIPRALDDPEWRVLHIIRDGLPSEVKQFVPAPVRGIV